MKFTIKSLATFIFLWVSFITLAQEEGLKINSQHPDFKIKVTRCEAMGKTVVIDMLFENVGPDDVNVNMKGTEFGGYGHSAAYDDEGNIYQGDNFKIRLGNSDLTVFGVSKTLPSEVPIKARIQLENVPESVKTIKRVDFRCDNPQWGLKHDKQVRLSNIPISREGDE